MKKLKEPISMQLIEARAGVGVQLQLSSSSPGLTGFFNVRVVQSGLQSFRWPYGLEAVGTRMQLSNNKKLKMDICNLIGYPRNRAPRLRNYVANRRVEDLSESSICYRYD